MLALPLIPPPDDQSSWQSNIYYPRSDSPPPQTAVNAPGQGQNQQPHHHRQQRQQRDEEKRLLQARSPLALLAADEAVIAQRKAAIRNFGAYWIRPPGISKTFQAMIEEEVERREQEELERQEQGLLDLQAQQQLEEAQQRAAETAEAQEAGDVTEERDLDEDVPEAEDDAFNEDSMLEGSHIEHEQEVYEDLEEAELLGVTRDEENLGIEHEPNLDDSVPEAASYQHSDDENSTSGSELQDSFAMPDQRQPRPQANLAFDRPEPAGGIFDRTRMLQRSLGAGLMRSPGSMTLSSPQVESSFAASSPVRPRGNRTARSTRRGHD